MESTVTVFFCRTQHMHFLKLTAIGPELGRALKGDFIRTKHQNLRAKLVNWLFVSGARGKLYEGDFFGLTPPPSSSHTWRFSSGFPIFQGCHVILAGVRASILAKGSRSNGSPDRRGVSPKTQCRSWGRTSAKCRSWKKSPGCPRNPKIPMKSSPMKKRNLDQPEWFDADLSIRIQPFVSITILRIALFLGPFWMGKTIVFQPSIFWRELLVSGRVDSLKGQLIWTPKYWSESRPELKVEADGTCEG